jgi:hypothetical protein
MVLFPLLQVTDVFGAGTYVWKAPGGLSEDLIYVTDLEFF